MSTDLPEFWWAVGEIRLWTWTSLGVLLTEFMLLTHLKSAMKNPFRITSTWCRELRQRVSTPFSPPLLFLPASLSSFAFIWFTWIFYCTISPRSSPFLMHNDCLVQRNPSDWQTLPSSSCSFCTYRKRAEHWIFFRFVHVLNDMPILLEHISLDLQSVSKLHCCMYASQTEQNEILTVSALVLRMNLNLTSIIFHQLPVGIYRLSFLLVW